MLYMEMKCESEARQLNLDRLLKHRLPFLYLRGNIKNDHKMFWTFFFSEI